MEEFSEASKQVWRDILKKYDTDNNGTVTKEELGSCLPSFGIFTEEDVCFVLEHFDTNGDGKLSIDEIVDNMNVLNQHCVNGTELLSAFNKIDKDGNGSISLMFELFPVLKHNGFMTREEALAAVKELGDKYDKDQNGRFNYTEFVNMYQSECMARDAVSGMAD